MKFTGFAIAAAFAAFVLAPLSAEAQSAPAAPKPYSKEQIEQGKKEVPAVLESVGVPCTMTDAAYVGASTAKDDKGKAIKQSVYEVACKEGLGYGLIAPQGEPAKAYDCVSLIGNASLACHLPENMDPKQGLAPMVAQTGNTCAISEARYLGSKPTGETYYEIGCGAAPGFILQTQKAQPPKTIGCDQVSGALACKFTTQAQLDAASNKEAQALLVKSGKTCQMTKSRKIGELQNGDMAYEVACQQGDGYVLEETTAGAYHTSVNCANVGDLCKLTDATKAETAETSTYQHLAQAGGFQCQVDKYRFIGIDNKTNSEVVELHCANRPDGAIAFFPTDNKGPAKFLDCVAAGAIGQSCKLSGKAPVLAKYTEALNSKGKKTCKVSDAQGLGETADGKLFVETACSDGLPGFVLVMTPTGTVSDVFNCAQAKASGAVCVLPGDLK
jgi:hypothetical protein